VTGDSGGAHEADVSSEPDVIGDGDDRVADTAVDDAEARAVAREGNGAVDPATQSDEELIEVALRHDATAHGALDGADGDETATAPPSSATSVFPASAVAEPDRRDQKRAMRTEARRVRRVVRKIDPWSVLKVSLIFYVCMYVILMIASVLLWSAAASSGTVDNIEDFVIDLGFSDFEFKADQMFRAAVFGGAILMVVGTGFTVLVSVLFNMISDLVGGIRVTMIEQEIERPRNAPAPSSRSEETTGGERSASRGSSGPPA
jgi:hypothetical protein